MAPPSGPGWRDASVCHASSCRFELPLGAMNGWRGGRSAAIGRAVQRAPSNSAGAGPSCGLSGIGSARAWAAASARSASASANAGLVARDDFVDEPVLGSLIRLEEAIAFHVGVDLLDRLARVVRIDLVDALARLEDLLGVDLDVRRLALEAGARLVDEDP